MQARGDATPDVLHEKKWFPAHAVGRCFCCCSPHCPALLRVRLCTTAALELCPALFSGSISCSGVKVGFLLLVSSLEAHFAWGGKYPGQPFFGQHSDRAAPHALMGAWA